jgi:tRNA(fMet)-specific endonuclease VapC
MAYLLDTNVWINYLKDSPSPIRAKLATVTPADIVLCSIVKAELWHGAEKYGQPERRRGVLAGLFAPYRSIAFDDAAATIYGHIHHELEIQGATIGPLDLQIAAISLANGLTLVSSNVSEFSRLPGLVFEDWLNKV